MEATGQKLLPREKLHQLGAGALSDAELLAIFLRTGSTGCHVMMLAAQLLEDFGSLYQVMTADKQHLSAIKGVGDAKLTQLQAIAELGKRFFNAQLAREDTLANPHITHQFLQSVLAHQEREVFMVIFLDNQHRVIRSQEMFSGTINSVEVHPREIIREALKINAVALILAHNHPSGIAEPSAADRDITQQIMRASALFNIRILDHLVIGRGEFVSFAERGWV
nr:DNA repair protein RadC [Pantoea sp. 201603H]